MEKQRKRGVDAAGLVFLAVLFIALVMLSNALFRGFRLDLTENNLYTISDGTRNILSNIEEPVNLYYFYSDRATENFPSLRAYSNRVREMLEEFVEYSDGKLKLTVTDPLPFSEEEDQASQFGLANASPGGDSIYFGLAGTNSVDDVEIISFFQPDKEAFLEYELAKLVDALASPKRPAVGLMTTLPMNAGFDPTTQQMRDAWVIATQLRQLFDVRDLPLTTTEIAEDIELLMLVHPKDFSDATLYAIDQFIMRGGKALLFVDPHADAESQPQDPSNPFPGMGASKSSDPGPLLQGWGIDLDTRQVVGDAKQALLFGSSGRRPMRHLAVIGVLEDNLGQDDVITSGLSQINVASSGFIVKQDDAEFSLEPLLSSTDMSMPIPVERLLFLPDPSVLQDGFLPTGEQYVLAARVTGQLPSAFPDGPPGGGGGSAHLAQSSGPVNLIVVADTDILTNLVWVQVSSFLGQQIANAFASNGDFVTNALENLIGSSDLISIRGRATYSRPFTTVQRLELDAEQRFRDTEQSLQTELAETERKLEQLESQKEEGSTRLILSPEQRAEIDRFGEEKLRIRKELRQVRRDLDRDIERLGLWLKIINIALIPALITIVAIFVLASGHRRRREQGVQHAG